MYLCYNKKSLHNGTSASEITQAYHEGFVFTRIFGEMDQTRSVRIHLPSFELSSENRRILRKTEDLTLEAKALPLSDYDWHIGKRAKDFYDQKFGKGTFTANKIKQLVASHESSFTTLLCYTKNSEEIGNAICYKNAEILHYSYPFYLLNSDKNTGMGMMLRAILFAKEQGCDYIYLGSAQRPTDSYKLQFSGLEWFDRDAGTFVKNDEKLKEILKNISQ